MAMASRVLILSDGVNVYSGYGALARAFASALRLIDPKIQVFNGSFQHVAAPVIDARTGIPIYAADNVVSMRRTIDMVAPDLIIHIRDLFAHTPRFYDKSYSLAEHRGRIRMIDYTMVQSDPMPFEAADAAVANFDLILVPTRWSQRRLAEAGVPLDMIDVVPPAIDWADIRVDPLPKSYFGLSPDRRTILSIGVATQARKNWPGLLRAFSLMRHEDAELFLYSSSGAYSLETFIAHLGIAGRVVMPQTIVATWGYAELPALFDIADLYMSMSTAEGINLPLIESLAHGTPCVATAHPNHLELMGDLCQFAETRKIMPSLWSFDYLPDPEDAARKADAILDMGPDERAALSERMRRRFEERYSVAALARALGRVLP